MDASSTAAAAAAAAAPMDVDDDDDSEADGPTIQVGPDLNQHRSLKDTKVYRQILLPNGLHAVLVSDTLAMGQRRELGDFSREVDSGYDSETSSVEMDDVGKDGNVGDRNEHKDGDEQQMDDGYAENDDDRDGDIRNERKDGDEHDGQEESEGYDDDEEEEEEESEIRKAAAAMVVRAGSFHDPLCCQGTAHYLEHMLFMGTEKHPSENEYDAFLQRNGGSDNAFTELEYTLYHFDVAQEKLFEALDMFSGFFSCPLLKPEAMERELKAIESEFQLSKNADECRLQELMCRTCGKDASVHPFGKFSWGNTQSLKTIPEANGVDVLLEVRKFYNQHYYARNMSLVIIGAYSLDELQEQVVQHFSSIPATPREPSPMQMQITDTEKIFRGVARTPIAEFGMPFPPSSLGRLYRVVPVKDRHALSITWQLPPQQNWRSKPADYISHLLGHESSGSILSALKAKSYVNACHAGIGSGGYENASSHALFNFNLTLSEDGVAHWTEIVDIIYMYIGMVRHHCRSSEGLPSYIYDELKSVQDVAYDFHDEPSPDELVEDLAEATTCSYLPPDRLLDGNVRLQEFDGEAIKTLLDNYFVPTNARIDLFSSTHGQDADYSDSNEGGAGHPPSSSSESSSDITFSRVTAGEPLREANFGTRYWPYTIDDDLLSKWDGLRNSPAPTSSQLHLPPLNPFIPKAFDLKPLPEDDPRNHPLVHCTLSVCIAVGPDNRWFPAKVLQHCRRSSRVRLGLEGEKESWHGLNDKRHDYIQIKPGFEGSFEEGVKFKVTGVPNSGEDDVALAGGGEEGHVEERFHFPAIPPPAPEWHLPVLISDAHTQTTTGVKVYHLQDRKFRRPNAELRMKIICAGANESPFIRACAELFGRICYDALVETCYQAEVCELMSSIYVSDVGFTIRVNGFDHKLIVLAKEILRVFFSFRDGDEDALPDTVKAGRFEACLEGLLRSYSNSGMNASSFCQDIRRQAILPKMWSSFSKAGALDGITEASLMQTISKMLRKVSIEALHHGNVTIADAKELEELLVASLSSPRSSVLQENLYPRQNVVKFPLSNTENLLVAPTKDSTDSNTSVEAYFQIGKDDVEKRVLIDLMGHILFEPLFDQIRTKEQFGYQVSCGARWTEGVIGMSFCIVTAVKSAQEASDRIERFLAEYRDDLVKMKDETFLEHVVGLAKIKLQMFNNLEEECGHYWSEIMNNRLEWEIHRTEALCLRQIKKEQLVQAYDDWLYPFRPGSGEKNERRSITVRVVGTSEAALAGRPNIKAVDKIGAETDENIMAVHCQEAARW